MADGHVVRDLTAGRPGGVHSVGVSRFARPAATTGSTSLCTRSRRTSSTVHARADRNQGARAGEPPRRADARHRDLRTRGVRAARWQDQVADRADRLTVTQHGYANASTRPAWTRSFGSGRRHRRLPPGEARPGAARDVDRRRSRRSPSATSAACAETRRTPPRRGRPGARHPARRHRRGPQQAWLRGRLQASVSFAGGSSRARGRPPSPRSTCSCEPGTRTTCEHVLREAAACGVPVVAHAPVARRRGRAPRHRFLRPRDPGGPGDPVAAVVADPTEPARAPTPASCLPAHLARRRRRTGGERYAALLGQPHRLAA